ncbi:hypothetical protein BGZ61DRAFT_477586 [Ilyonectria robusta]|uniref:uncharacterized protein n=1 Tax=Ilyonectria robusta TaxID=1079257 RepID=UPI001E8CB8C3|nr:uncharacterized protein BGZ61DRAFT_477586 [Ilyonectria robusta]KAH8699603.1 hypothetical protein BGZ61DRAFT_477586 [Ilyonectria robusta]
MGWLHRLCLSLPASAGSSYSSYLLTCHHPHASRFLLVAKNHGSCTPLTSILDPTLSICPSCPSVVFIGNARNPPLRDAPAAIRGSSESECARRRSWHAPVHAAVCSSVAPVNQ